MSGSTIPQTETIASTVAGWTQVLNFGQFDPSLGTLLDVRIGVTALASGTVGIENLGAAAARVDVAMPVEIDLPAYDISVAVDPFAEANLGAYDGATDAAGTSGTIISGIDASGTTVAVVGDPDLAAFTGVGTIALTAQSVANAIETGDGNLFTELATFAGAVVSVQYDYAAGGTPYQNEYYYTFPAYTQEGNANALLGEDFTNSTTTAPQQFSVPLSTVGWSTTLPVAQFNPALGTLEAVDVLLNGSLVGTVAAENAGNLPITFQSTQSALVSLGLAGTITAAIDPTIVDSMNLGAFDGTTDFAGTSGHADIGLTNAPFTIFDGSETDPSVLAAFTGTGTYDVPIGSLGTSYAEGGALLVSKLLAEAGADVQISYVYLPADDVACFAAGTLIQTTAGPIAVEDLTPGMHAVTLAQPGSAPILWIGHRTVDCGRHPKPAAVWPIRIRKDAFGPGVPSRDVRLSPDHAIFFDDVLIPIRVLVNGTTVAREEVERIRYFHVELKLHSVLLADGLPVESYLETGGRSAFANSGKVTQLNPEFAPWIWEGYGCAPLTVTGPPVEKARALLAARQAKRTGRRVTRMRRSAG